MAEHVITRDAPTHRAWDATLAPVLEVEPGDVVVAETDDFAGGQVTHDSTAADLLTLDFDAIYPLAGPIAVRGARPGDALAIEILGFELPEWGWACIIPGLGLLPQDEFPEPALRVFDRTLSLVLDRERARALGAADVYRAIAAIRFVLEFDKEALEAIDKARELEPQDLMTELQSLQIRARLKKSSFTEYFKQVKEIFRARCLECHGGGKILSSCG